MAGRAVAAGGFAARRNDRRRVSGRLREQRVRARGVVQLAADLGEPAAFAAALAACADMAADPTYGG